MIPYHKIHSVFKRDPENNHKTFIDRDWTRPEFNLLQNMPWRAEEKVDGTNIRITYTPEMGTPQFGGRTDAAQLPAKLVAYLNEVFTAQSMALAFPELSDGSVILYGEGHGAGIQKGGGNYVDFQLKSEHPQQFVLFDVLIVGHNSKIWLERTSVEDIAATFQIPAVPVFGEMTLNEAIDTIRQEGPKLLSHMPLSVQTAKIEGFVMKPVVGLLDRMGRRIITKIKTKDWPRSE